MKLKILEPDAIKIVLRDRLPSTEHIVCTGDKGLVPLALDGCHLCCWAPWKEGECGAWRSKKGLKTN